MLLSEVQHVHLPAGQYEARTRWRTHESGAVFDQKKIGYLSTQAQTFIAQQMLCVLAGEGHYSEVQGALALGRPGFVQILDDQTCLIPIGDDLASSALMHGVRRAQACGHSMRIGLCFISHFTRTRLSVHGTAALVADQVHDKTWLCCTVSQAFFHCPKYIRTGIAGLTMEQSEPEWHLPELLYRSRLVAPEPLQVFIAQRNLCFLCTVSQDGQHTVNHRGGRTGFLVTLPPDETTPYGRVLLPDYAGNGAFEAIGNILETGQAALVLPSYSNHLAISLSGNARVDDLEQLPLELQSHCVGAVRVITLSVQYTAGQIGDWSIPLSYECVRAASHRMSDVSSRTCPV